MTLRNKSPASSLSQLLNYAYGIQLSEKDSILSKNIFGLTQQKWKKRLLDGFLP
jgi:hypothetical protein